MPTNIPIVTCGNNKPDATGVHAGMKPEYEGKTTYHLISIPYMLTLLIIVIYAGFQLSETLQELPLLLAGQGPPPESLHTQIASNTFIRRPVAIIAGGGYDDTAFETLRYACIAACGSKAELGVAFFRADNQLTDRLAAEGKGPQKKTPEYAKAIGQRLKARLGEVGIGEGLREQDIGELFWY